MSTPPLRAAVSSRTRPVAAAMVAIAGWWVWGSAAGSRTPAAAAWVPASALDAAVPQRVTEAELWLAPPGNPAPSALARAIDELAGGRPAAALPIFEANVSDPALSGYARLYVGRANLALHRPEEAARAARQLLQTGPAGYLDEAALWLLADACEATGNWAEAVAPLRTLTEIKSSRPGLALFRLGRAAEKSGDSSLAAQAYSKVYYDFPLSDEADDAGLGLSRLSGWSADRLPMELARAQQLFTAKKFSESRKAYEALRPRVSGDDRGLVDLRVAECDVSLQRYPAGRDGLRAYMNVWSTRLPEAEFYYLAAERGLGREAEYVAAVQAFVENHPASPLAETALNDLGTHYILANDDAKAAEVFAELYRRFPQGADADRAAWKAGWWAYKNGAYDDTVRIFDSAAVTFPHADYRPPWLYWSGRANERRHDLDAAAAKYRQVIADYRNSYYGRQAAARLEHLPLQPAVSSRVAASAGSDRSSAPDRQTPERLFPGAIMFTPPASSAAPAPVPARLLPVGLAPGTPPPNARLIQTLLTAGLYDDAISEIRRVESESGTTPMLEATIAYALNRKGELRPAITVMRRAYPQFIAAGGEALPAGLLNVIFPVQYWDLIRQHATAHKLDPYLMAALIAQESTFQADVRSGANAFGLMQLLPSTGRRYAPRLDIRPFSVNRLVDPEVNIRIGMAYFADLVGQFGDTASALAAYNAGPNRLSRWRAERPGIDPDEFIDDIPFPETQNYVKRVIGTSDDYRFLYGSVQVATRQ